LPRAWSHDEWYAFIEQLTGLREDTAQRNPRCIREIRIMALELSEHPNPFDTIEALQIKVAKLSADLTEKADTHDPPKGPRPGTRAESPA
jgi:hypothetical protein